MIRERFELPIAAQLSVPPRGVVEAIDDPRSRVLILQAAKMEGRSEIELRRDLAKGHLALAARKHGSSDDGAFEMLKTELRKRIAAARKTPG
jgi:hypothetical protein